MCIVKAPQSEPIPGYRLVEHLGQGGFGEVWKCEAPGGLLKAIKFIRGGDPDIDPHAAGAKQELRALQRIKLIRHPFLLSIERIEVVEGDVLIVMELADCSLHDLVTERRAAGRAGIERTELLGYLHEAAEAIDVMNQEHGLQHLDIKPRNLFLVGRHVKVADFGLVASLSDLQRHTSWQRRSETLTPLYAAPETFLGSLTLFSDQYSLAITYQELLTGTLPFTGRNFRQLALRHIQEPPNLGPLPEADRPIVARALAKKPRERYPSCRAFVQALSALSDVPVPRFAHPKGTHADLALGDLAVTPVGNRVARSAVLPPAPRAAEPGNETSVFLAGYQLLECVHRHNTAELWKAQTTNGRKRLVRIIQGYDPAEEHPGGDPLTRLRELRHPALPRYEIQTGLGGRLALITDSPDGVLLDRLRECRQIGHAGIPRPELLVYLRHAAEALDDLYEDHRLQHLGLSPRQLVLRGGLLYLLDFGLSELFWLPAGHDLAALNTRYAAPELFERQVSRHGDQYSLALIYQELLTGIHAFRNYNQRQMALARLRGKPDLGMLPATDRPVIAQALDLDPDQRFPSCTGLVEALESVAAGRGLGASTRGTQGQIATVSVPVVPAEMPADRSGPTQLLWDRSLEEMKHLLAEQVAEAAGDSEARVRRSLHFRIQRPHQGERGASSKRGGTAGSPALEYRGYGRIVPATVRLKLTGFEQEWKARRLEAANQTAGRHDSRTLVASWRYRVELEAKFWQRCLGRSPGLLVGIELAMPQTSTEGLTDVRIHVRPADCSADKGMELLEHLGPRLVQSMHEHLQLPSDRRGEARFDWIVSVQIRPWFSQSEIGEGLAAQTRDISSSGIGLELPCRPPCELLLLDMNPSHRAPLTVPLQVLHSHPLGDGRQFVGARFALELVSSSSS
ncbi:MAG TPA: protein kinase [Gemmataceae bacterium]|nr:protein kinase [Gemmataceae bacterium]